MPIVKPEILVWAREKSFYTIEEAARKLNIKDSKIETAASKLTAYESGVKIPSRSLLLRMSKKYRIPLLAFYLDKPPETGDRGEDFRTLPDSVDETDRVYVNILIREIKARQSTVRDTLIEAEEAESISFIGKHNLEDGIENVLATVREQLDVDISEFRNQKDYKAAFRYLRQAVESLGVFVVLKGNLGSYHSNISLDVFRGFALSDNIAPFIVINDQDSEAAWSFTLIHEFIHLILGKTGISSAYYEHTIEKFCNDVASEFLLPSNEFVNINLSVGNFEMLKKDISEFAFQYKLSSTHLSYRLYKSGIIDVSLWNKLSEYYKKKWFEHQKANKDKGKQKEGGPSYYVLKKYRLGTLVGLVERLTYSGILTTTKAGMLLDIKPIKVHRLFQT